MTESDTEKNYRLFLGYILTSDEQMVQGIEQLHRLGITDRLCLLVDISLFQRPNHQRTEGRNCV